MSINNLNSTEKKIIICPKCSSKQAVEITSVIHSGSQQLQELFESKLNRVTCDECSAEFIVDGSLLFRDDDANFFVYCMPIADHSMWQQAEVQMKQLTEKIFIESDIDAPECRLTLDRKHFIEKIAIHNHKLNDRIIEYIKYMLYNNNKTSTAAIDSVRSEILYNFSGDDKDVLPFVIIDRETGRVTNGTHIPFELYKELDSTFGGSENYTEEMKQIFPGYYVSVDRLLF